jgi:hypothetical protein
MGESIIGHVPSVNNPAGICQVARSVITLSYCCCMTLLIEHLIILLAEEVCGSWRFPGCMGSHIHNQMFGFLAILLPHCVCH